MSAPSVAEASRVTPRPRTTVWSGPAWATITPPALTVTVTVIGAEAPPGPVTTNWKE